MFSLHFSVMIYCVVIFCRSYFVYYEMKIYYFPSCECSLKFLSAQLEFFSLSLLTPTRNSAPGKSVLCLQTLFFVWAVIFSLISLHNIPHIFKLNTYHTSRAQWPHGLGHELLPPDQAQGSWVWFPLEAWMSIYGYSVCVVLCVVRGLATGWSPTQGVLLTMYGLNKQE
jgi:hypothetical protein